MRRWPVIGVLAALSLASAGCGGSSSYSVKLSPVAFVRQAASKTSQLTSEHMVLSATGGAGGVTVDLSGAGDYDNVNHVGDMHVSISAQGQQMSMDGVMSGTTMYLKAPLFAGKLPQGKTWIEVDLQKVGESKGIDFSSLISQSPQQSLAALEQAGQVTNLGSDTVDGVATTHYQVQVDLSKLPQGAKIEALTKAQYEPIDVWIGNDDGYVHQVKMGFTETIASVGAMNLAMTETFSNFGATVNIDVPSSDEAFDATSEVLQAAGSH